jgi:glycosyltransferase involved in cell wall biosynthesis
MKHSTMEYKIDDNLKLYINGVKSNSELNCILTYSDMVDKAIKYRTSAISVVIPVINGCKNLYRLLSSLRNQTYKDFHVIVVDDGSDTDLLKKNFNEFQDLKITSVTVPNCSLPFACNRGYGAVMGEFTIFCNTDIDLHPQIFEKMVNALNERLYASWTYTDYMSGNDIQKCMSFDVEKMLQCNICHELAMIRSNARPIFNENINELFQWDMLLSMMDNGYMGYYIEETLYRVENAIAASKEDIDKIHSMHKLDIDNVKLQKRPFSILVTAYDSADYIVDCLDSIQNQTYFKDFDNYEIIVGVDNCPKTLDKLKSIASEYKNLFVYMMDNNMGTYITTNTLIGLCSHNNILRFDSDDVMYDCMIDELFKHVHYYDIVKMGFVNFNDNITNIEIDKKLRISDGVLLFKKFIMDNVLGGFKPWICSADSEICSRANNYANIHILKKPLFYRRKHASSLTQDSHTGMGSEIRENYKKQILKCVYPEDQVMIERITNSYRRII